MVKTKEIRKKISLLDEIILEYKQNQTSKKINWKNYEQKLFVRVKKAILFFDNYIIKAINLINFKEEQTSGRPRKLNLEQKVRILLIQRLINKSNRDMSFILMLFSGLTNINISYKTVERIYDDEKVILVLENIHQLILNEKNINSPNITGDGTGYVLTVKEHYASIASKLKEKKSTKKQKILFSFTLMDVDTRIYIAYGCSFKSEKDAFNKAYDMLLNLNINLNSIRLDRYYSGKNLVKKLCTQYNGIKVYLIPKKNVTVGSSKSWNSMLKKFLEDTNNYLKEYFKRNQSESGFSEDKRRFGWKIPQKIDKRINLSNFAIFTWHNLYWVGD
jgi:transposase